MKHPIPVNLSKTDRACLQTFIHAGKANARTFTRACVLVKAAEGWTDAKICDAFDISRRSASLHKLLATYAVIIFSSLDEPETTLCAQRYTDEQRSYTHTGV